MAQFLLAKFLSQALEWKARFPNTQFYGGLRFEPFIYERARKIFPNYSKLYPDNKEFTQRFVRDLRNKDTTLLKIINPDQLGPDLETASIQFETEARLEQQVVAQTNPQEVTQPFSLSSPPIPRVSFPAGLPSTEEKPTMTSQTEEQAHKIPKVPGSFVNTVNNFGSRTGIFFQRNVGKYLTAGRIGTVVSTGIGAIAGAKFGSMGMLAGAGAGAVLPSWVRSGGATKFLGNLGNGMIEAGARFSNYFSNRSLLGGSSKKMGLKIGLAVLGTFLLIGGIASLGALQGTTPSGEAAPIPGNVGIATGSGDISSCEFTHQNRIYKVGSSKLRSLIAEVAAKTGVPASVIAAIALQETANFTVQATDTHPAFAEVNFYPNGCDPHFPTSNTGALGLMQVQPPENISTFGAKYDPKAADLNGLKIGLSFLGRDLNSLTKNDFCDVRTSLYLGAGVMISKNGGKPPTTPDEVGSVACKYHGTCQAGGYSYADEVKKGFEQCKPTPATAIAVASSCPVPSGKIVCGSQFTPVNGCGHCGVGYGGAPKNCIDFEGTKYALDITGSPNQQVILPNVNGAVVQWVWKRQEADTTQAIQIYIGTETDSGKQYYLQFHHTQPGSGKGGLSGEVGGEICAGGCDHIHMQVGSGGDNTATTKWLDAAQYFCRQ